MIPLATAVISSVLFFQLNAGHAANMSAAQNTAHVMRERLAAAQIHGSAQLQRGDRIRVTFDGASPIFVKRLLTQPGRLTFKIVPNGPVYRSPSAQPFRDAKAGRNARGLPIVWFTVSDPPSFYRFTSANLDKTLGIYLDGTLLTKPQIHAPISQYAEIDGRFSPARTQLIAAVIDSGPLPERVTLIP